MHPRIAARLTRTLDERHARFAAERRRAAESVRTVLSLLATVERYFDGERIGTLKDDCQAVVQAIEDLAADDPQAPAHIDVAVGRLRRIAEALRVLLPDLALLDHAGSRDGR
jgi:hypothetical protein